MHQVCTGCKEAAYLSACLIARSVVLQSDSNWMNNTVSTDLEARHVPQNACPPEFGRIMRAMAAFVAASCSQAAVPQTDNSGAATAWNEAIQARGWHWVDRWQWSSSG